MILSDGFVTILVGVNTRDFSFVGFMGVKLLFGFGAIYDDERRRLLFWQNHFQGLLPSSSLKGGFRIASSDSTFQSLNISAHTKYGISEDLLPKVTYNMGLNIDLSSKEKNNQPNLNFTPIAPIKYSFKKIKTSYINQESYGVKTSSIIDHQPFFNIAISDNKKNIAENFSKGKKVFLEQKKSSATKISDNIQDTNTNFVDDYKDEIEFIEENNQRPSSCPPILNTSDTKVLGNGQSYNIIYSQYDKPKKISDKLNSSSEILKPFARKYIKPPKDVFIKHTKAKSANKLEKLKSFLHISTSSIPLIRSDDAVPKTASKIDKVEFKIKVSKSNLPIQKVNISEAKSPNILEKIDISFVPLKSSIKIYDITSLVQAIYEDKFDLVEEILHARKDLIHQQVMQLGPEFICPEDQEEFVLYLAGNKKGSTWKNYIERDISLEYQEEPKKDAFLNEEIDSEKGEVAFSFAKNSSSNLQILQKVRFKSGFSKKESEVESKINFDSMLQNNIFPLHLASLLGAKNAVSALIMSGADPNIQDKEGYTPMHHAVMNNNLDTVAILCSYYDVENEKKSFRDRETPSELAAYVGNEDIFDCLLSGNISLIKMNHLYMAIKGNSYQMVSHLLEIRDFADRITKNEVGSALLYSIKKNNLEIFQSLLSLSLSKGLNLDFVYQSKNIFHYIAESEKASYLAEIIFPKFKQSDLRKLLCSRDDEGNTPMHIAAFNTKSYLPFKHLCGNNSFEIKSKMSFFSSFTKSSNTSYLEILDFNGNSPDELYEKCIGDSVEETIF